jgi:hypothetical protein
VKLKYFIVKSSKVIQALLTHTGQLERIFVLEQGEIIRQFFLLKAK